MTITIRFVVIPKPSHSKSTFSHHELHTWAAHFQISVLTLDSHTIKIKGDFWKPNQLRVMVCLTWGNVKVQVTIMMLWSPRKVLEYESCWVCVIFFAWRGFEGGMLGPPFGGAGGRNPPVLGFRGSALKKNISSLGNMSYILVFFWHMVSFPMVFYLRLRN